MLLTLTTTHTPATDLGYLLYKHPDRVQSWDLNWGVATVFYPEATPERCTAALLLDIDPVGLVRRDEGEGFALQQYVNDRPYVASSFFAVAMARVLRNAMSGECKERPTLAATPIPLVATLAALPCRGGPALIERLFAPLGYTLQIEAPALDETRPDWGAARVAKVTLSATVRLSALLNHLYVLIPVLDAEKHYWVDREEAEKLLRHGQGWLEHHPERTLITERFLGKAARSLSREVLSRLAGEGVVEADPEAEEIERGRGESAMERPLSLDQRRIAAVREALLAAGARSVIDMGCGEGKLLKALVQEPRFTRLTGVDVSVRTLQITARRLDLERIEDREPGRLRLLQGSAPYRDPRLEGADALVMVEVIEHLEPFWLPSLSAAIFGALRPPTILLTTPNVEYNTLFAGLPPGTLRHGDHRFEWTRAEFQAWCEGRCAEHGYTVAHSGIGEAHPELGAPTQMAVFTRCA